MSFIDEKFAVIVRSKSYPRCHLNGIGGYWAFVRNGNTVHICSIADAAPRERFTKTIYMYVGAILCIQMCMVRGLF